MAGGLNVYAYANDNPVKYRDLSGLDSQAVDQLSDEEVLDLANKNPINVHGTCDSRCKAVGNGLSSAPTTDERKTGTTASPKPLRASSKSKTVFTPGVMHDHKPSGKWAEVQDDPKSDFRVKMVCKMFDPEGAMTMAGIYELQDKWIASDHLRWFRVGGGADYDEDSNLDVMLQTDSGVQKKIAKQDPDR